MLDTLVRKVTRNSGRYTPGFYTKIKISPAISPPKRKVTKKVKNILGLSHFKKELQCLIIKNLRAKGSSLRSGIFVISDEIEDFLKKNYSITKRWKNSQLILKDLEIAIRVYLSESSNNAVQVTDFQTRLGNARKQKCFIKVYYIEICIKILFLPF